MLPEQHTDRTLDSILDFDPDLDPDLHVIPPRNTLKTSSFNEALLPCGIRWKSKLLSTLEEPREGGKSDPGFTKKK